MTHRCASAPVTCDTAAREAAAGPGRQARRIGDLQAARAMQLIQRMRATPHPRSVEWLALALVLASTLIATLAMAGSVSTGTSLAVMAVLIGTFVLAVGALFGPRAGKTR
jgi:hypothetical protein